MRKPKELGKKPPPGPPPPGQPQDPGPIPAERTPVELPEQDDL